MSRQRIGILGFLHESNTFIRDQTTFEDFEKDWLFSGIEIIDRLTGANHEVSGFISGLQSVAAEFEIVPIVVARAMPYGVIEASTFDRILSMIITGVKDALPLDGLLVAPHGATVSEMHRDADGQWLAAVRQVVGPDIPIVGTLDPHANLSSAMVKSCTALAAYRTNPHIDQFDTGTHAADLLVQTIRGDMLPSMVATSLPVAVNIQRQNTDVEPWFSLHQLAGEWLRESHMVSYSLLFGFPYAEVDEMGLSLIAVADGDVSAANEFVHVLQSAIFERLDEFDAGFEPIAETLQRCKTLAGPICLLDMGDNVGAGSPADSTYIIHELLRCDLTNAFICLYDPQTVASLASTDVGETISLSLGGRAAPGTGKPWTSRFELLGKYDGRFSDPTPRHGGATEYDQGDTAVVRHHSRMTVMLTSLRQPPYSLCQLSAFGLDPSDFHILVAKGVNSPIAAYRDVCRTFVEANSPGPTSADLRALNYVRRRKPMFPFEKPGLKTLAEEIRELTG